MLKRDITATFAGNVVTTIFFLGISVILARVLGPANRGLLGLALLIPSITATFCVLGQGMVNSTFAGLYKDNRSSLFQQSLIITLFGAVVSTVVICAFYFWLPVAKGQFGRLTHQHMALMCIVPPVFILATTLTSLVRGIGRITAAAVIQVVQVTVLLGLMVVFLLWWDFGLKTALLLTALSPLVAVALSLWVLRDYVTLRPSKFSGWLFKKSLRFGSQISLATLGGFLVYRVDQGILAFMVPAEQVGFYIVAVGLAERLRLLPNSISTAFLPRLANDMATRQAQVPMVFRCTTIISAASMLLLAILGAPVILVFFGWEYSQSILPFLLLLPGIMVLGGASLLSGDLATREKPKYSVWTSHTVLIANIGLNFCLIPFMGIAGAALASTISYILDCCMTILFYRHESRVPLREMMPRLKDVKYVFAAVVSLIHRTTADGNSKLQSTENSKSSSYELRS